MKRYVIMMISVLMLSAPLAMSKLGSSQAQEKPKGDVEAGKALYATHCKKCHGDQGQGVPRMYKLVGATIVHLGSKQAQDQSDDFIRKSMTIGYKKMEPIKELNAQQIEHILAFTRTLKEGAAPKVDEAPPKKEEAPPKKKKEEAPPKKKN